MIDRKALVSRHNPVYLKTKTASPLSVGNGRFCFTVDFTGLQSTMPMRFPLCTMSEWLWHRYPDAPNDDAQLRLTDYDTFGRLVGYATSERNQEALFKGLRQNAHRANIARLGFVIEGASYEDYTAVQQTLSLWEGIITSSFTVKGTPVRVETLVRPDEDTICVRVVSSLVSKGLSLALVFPYPSHKQAGEEPVAADRHHTSVERRDDGVLIRRVMDETRYFGQARLGAGLSDIKVSDTHTLSMSGAGEILEFCVRFTQEERSDVPDTFFKSKKSCAVFWEKYWNEGAAIDLSSSLDPRAAELERRVVLSQYLTAIQSRGALPPAETGLTCNSWYGKFHLEMHYWHSAHFTLWNRVSELEKSLSFYKRILPVARGIAASQGYAGARWPKMSDRSGYNSPSSIAVLLVWQQPHPIMLAELCYRRTQSRAFLEEYRDVVMESATFMSSFAHQDGERYVLGAPLIPAQERFDPHSVLNPGFEVAYFRWALRQANEWLTRLGEKPNPRFTEVADHLAAPAIHDSVYIAHENCPNTFTEHPFYTDHPSMLAMLGILPGDGIDRDVMKRTFKRVVTGWDFSSTWGWDFPMMAMCAARLGLRHEAVNILLMDTPKNTYLTNGHNAQAVLDDLPLYLPGNSGLLLAVAMMAAGWDGDDGTAAPGFPQDGSFVAHTEGLGKYV
ncbi:MAG: hypothetical protein LBS86_01465 [Treponema sp.]|jgi:hypothetical protein|nr:hypothetical protein [Treponema sp.]